MDPNHYILILNRVKLRDTLIPARLIADRLLQNRIWLFSYAAPFRSRLAPGDQAVVYLAGVGERDFIAKVELASGIREASQLERKTLEDLGLAWFDLAVDLNMVDVFTRPVPIAPLVPDMRFIGNKRYYGHYLRQSVAAIGPKDYAYILKHAMK